MADPATNQALSPPETEEHGALGEHAGNAHGAAVAASAEHAQPHAEPKALGMDATQWVALAMVIVLAIVIWKKVPAAIGAALDRKIATIRQQLDQAAKLRAEAEALKAEYEAKAAAADAEAAAIVERARHEAEELVKQAKTDTEAMIERRGRMAEDKIAAAERAALADVRARAVSAAAAAAERLIRERHDPAADKAMVDRTIAELGKA
jgi:F-type H+-transporting ATPase subunit b